MFAARGAYIYRLYTSLGISTDSGSGQAIGTPGKSPGKSATVGLQVYEQPVYEQPV